MSDIFAATPNRVGEKKLSGWQNVVRSMVDGVSRRWAEPNLGQAPRVRRRKFKAPYTGRADVGSSS